MTRPKKAYPVSSYGPELMAALIQGNRGEVKLEFPNRRIAAKFQLRINQLRAAMRAEDHADYPIAARTVCSIYWGARAGRSDDPDGNNYAKIILKPRDSEFASVLKTAGVEVNALSQDPLAAPTANRSQENDPQTGGETPSSPKDHPRDFLSEIGIPAAYPDEESNS